MHSRWCSSNFLRFLKFFQIKEGGPNFMRGSNSLEQLNYLVPHLYFNFRNFKDPNSSSFITFQSILHDSAVLFSAFWKLIKLKSRGLISWGEAILQNGWIIWSPLLYFNFRSLKNTNSSSFMRFQCLLHDSGVLLSGFWNFSKLSRGTYFLEGNQLCRRAELFGPPFCILILEAWRTQILCQSLDLMHSTWDSSTFPRFFKFFQIKEGGPNFLWGTNSAERLNDLVPPSVLQFQNFEGPKFFVIHYISMRSTWFSSTFLRFFKFPQIKEGGSNLLVEPILENGWIIWSRPSVFQF